MCSTNTSEYFFVSSDFQTDFDQEATFIVTNRGFRLTKYGYEYTKDKEVHDVSHWRCLQRKMFQCKAKARTKKIGNMEMVKFIDAHNHSLNNNAI